MRKPRIPALVVIGLIASAAAWFHVAARNGRVPIGGGSIPIPADARLIGPLAPATQMDIALSLRLRNEGDLEKFLLDVQTPGSPVYHKYLTMEQFVERYSPAEEDYNRAIDFLRASGFEITEKWENRICVGASGTAQTVAGILGVRMNQYLRDGRACYAAAEAPRIPADLARFVDAVVGLDTVHQYRTNHRILRSVETESPGFVYFGPPQFQNLYGLNVTAGVNDGSNQNIAVILWESNYSKSDIQKFWSAYGINQTTSNIKVIGVGKAPPGFDPNDGACQELALDTQYTSSFTAYSTQAAYAVGGRPAAPMAGGPKVTCYIAKDASTTSLLSAEQKFLADGKKSTGPKLASLSFGIGETYLDDVVGISSAEKAVFENAAATGLTVCVSSGDDGSQGGAPWGDNRAQASWPSSSPYVASIGGTTMNVSGSTLKSEVVWKDGSGVRTTGGASTGGGYSSVFTKPSWQSGKGVPSTNARCVPDISLDADPDTGYAVVLGGQTYSFGGTSASSPALASFFAGVNQQMRRAKGQGATLGQVTIALYDLFRTKSSTVYRDVTSGNNVKYKAQKGYDLCTGVGTIRADALATALASR